MRQRFAALLEPEAALAVIRRHVRSDALGVRCSAVRKRPNRFVVRVDVEAGDGTRATYALKGYADGRGEEIGDLYRALLRHCEPRGEPYPVIQPRCYLREEGLLVTPWVHGISLADALRAGRVDLIPPAARALAQLHAIPIVPEPTTPAQAMVQFTVAHGERCCRRSPEACELITPLTVLLQAALPHLCPSSPKLVHGDPGPENFLLDGDHWLLLDLDTYGYADPAYDAGYLLAKLEYECLSSPVLKERAPDWVTMMRDACLETMPELAVDNVSFFYAMTLIRKVLVHLFRVAPAERDARWSDDVAHVVTCVTTALKEVIGRSRTVGFHIPSS